MGPPPLRAQAGQPREQAPVRHHRRWHGAGRGVGRGKPGRARVQRQELLHPGFAPTGAQHRGPGRHQRGQKLPERRRQHLAAVLRHGQGRRLPRPRGQRLPPGASQQLDHRPVRRPGGPIRPGVRRPAGQPLLRRCAALADVLRPRPDRPAVADRGVQRTHGQLRDRRQGAAVPAPRNARRRGRQRPGARDHRPQPGHRRDGAPRGPRGGPVHGRLRQRLLPVHQRQGLQRHRDLPRLQARGGLRQPVFHPDPPDLHPGPRDLPVQAHAHEREPAQRRPGMGAEDPGRQATRQPDHRGRARLFPGAQVPELRQPRPARRGLPQLQGAVRPGQGGGRHRAGGLPRFRRRHPPRRPSRQFKRSTATSSRCTRRSPERTPTRPR